MTDLNRSQFIARGAKGGLALMAGGAVVALAACGDSKTGAGATTAATTGSAGTGDAAIASLAATAELLAIDFYGMAIASGFFTGDVLAYMTAAGGHISPGTSRRRALLPLL